LPHQVALRAELVICTGMPMLKKITLPFVHFLWLLPFSIQTQNSNIAQLPLAQLVNATSLEALSNMVLTDTKITP
jgi:hypothetical protein